MTLRRESIVREFRGLNSLTNKKGPGANEMTVVHPVQDGHAQRLRTVLRDTALLQRSPISQGVHFLHVALIDGDSKLLFCALFCGEFDEYLGRFAQEDPAFLDQVFGHCTGYPPRGAQDFRAFLLFLLSGLVRSDYLFASDPGRVTE